MAGGATYCRPFFLNTNCLTHRLSEKIYCKIQQIPVFENPLKSNVLVSKEEYWNFYSSKSVPDLNSTVKKASTDKLHLILKTVKRNEGVFSVHSVFVDDALTYLERACPGTIDDRA